MPWSFVVVSETVAGVADLDCGFVELDKLERWDREVATVDLARAKDRIERVLREDVFNVGDEQFLMLLLMMKPEGQDGLDLGNQFLVSVRNKILDTGIDGGAILFRFINCWPRNQSAK